MTEPQRPADLEEMAAAWQSAAERVRAGLEEFVRSLGVVAAQWQINALRSAQGAGRVVIPQVRPKVGDMHALSKATAAAVQRHTAPALDRMNRAVALQTRQNRHTGPRRDLYRHRGN
jgi:hypothetical protein